MNRDDFVIENRFITTNKPKRKKKKILPIILLLLLIGVLAFLIYEVKFAKKDDNKKSDEYSEYDPDYPLESEGYIQKEEEQKETSNIGESITSNITSNAGVTSNSIKSNSNKTSNVTSNNGKTSNTMTKDTTKPVISNFKVSSKTDTSITVSGTYKDDITSTSKLIVRYSKDGGKTWQTSNKFTGLEQNTKYTITVEVTDESGNKATTQCSGTTNRTALRSNLTGTYKDGSNYIYVYQLNESEIVYKADNSWSYAILTGDAYEKESSNGFISFDYKYLTYRSKKYSYYNSGPTADSIFKELYGSNYTFTSSTLCNGKYTSGSYSLYLVGAKDTSGNISCSMYANVAIGKGWLPVSGKITESENMIAFGQGGQSGTLWITRCIISGTKMTVTNGGSNKTHIGNNTAGTYTRSKVMNINDAIELKIRGLI